MDVNDNQVSRGITDDRLAQSNKAILLLSALIGLASLVASDGLYILDEFIIAASVEALYASGSFAYENGYETFSADSLKLWLFVSGPHGLVPQYPIGSTVLGAALTGFTGIRGLIFINALSAILTLFVTRQLARHLFGNERIALLSILLLAVCTFWLEFALGIWPHMISVLAVTCATYFAIRSLDAARTDAIKWASLSGLIIGAGMLVRVDTLLVLLPIGLCIFLFGRHATASMVAGTVGLVPGVLIMAIANQYKFGSYNPLSYGKQGGPTDVSSHTVAIGVACVAILLVLLFAKRVPWRDIPRMGIVASALAAVLFLLLAPGPREYLWQYLSGFWALLVDAGSIQDPRSGVTPNADGVLYFWGFVKKALGQSMPWVGVMMIWISMPRSALERRTLAIFLMTATLWSLPFILKAWHGGLGSNMRYFLPLLPFLCVMSAAAWHRLSFIAGSDSRSVWAGLAAGMIITFLWVWFGPSGMDGAQQIMSTYVFLAVCAACSFTALIKEKRRAVAPMAQLLVAAGFSVSVVFGALDLSTSQTRRNWTAQVSDSLSEIPSPSLVLGPPEILAFQIGRPDGLIALTDSPTNDSIDRDLITSTIKAGYGVYAPAELVAAIVHADPTFAIGPRSFGYPGGELHEISLR